MNPLFNQTHQTTGPRVPNIGQLMDFIKNTSPQQAKAQVERLVQEQGISASEFEEYKQKAQSIARTLGLL